MVLDLLGTFISAQIKGFSIYFSILYRVKSFNLNVYIFSECRGGVIIIKYTGSLEKQNTRFSELRIGYTEAWATKISIVSLLYVLRTTSSSIFVLFEIARKKYH